MPRPSPARALCQQEQMEDMRKKEEHLEKEMAEVSLQNRRLADPLQKAKDEMNEMQRRLGSYERDKQILVVSFLLNSFPSFESPLSVLGPAGKAYEGMSREALCGQERAIDTWCCCCWTLSWTLLKL